MREIFLIARREYLAYVGAWGFWVSLLTTPLIIAAIAFAPLMLSRAEPVRLIAVLAERPSDAAVLREAFAEAEPAVSPTRRGEPARFAVVDPPAGDIEALKPYLTGARTVTHDGAARSLFAVLHVRRDGEAVTLDYWSANLTDRAAANRARTALSRAMRSEALVARGVPEGEVAEIQALAPTVQEFDPRAQAAGPPATVTWRDRAPFVAGFVLAFILWSAVISVANMLLTSTLEEKSNKILDALLTSAGPRQILAGKLIGVAAISVTLFSLWGLLGSGAVAAAAATLPDAPVAGILEAALRPELIAIFAACFVGGYLIYGALFLAIGALCETLHEAQTLLSPLMMVMIVPLIAVAPAFENPHSPVISALSWFPPFTPFLTMIRGAGGLALWELLGLMAVMAAFAALILTLSARVFRSGVEGELTIAQIRDRFLPGRRRAGEPEKAGDGGR